MYSVATTPRLNSHVITPDGIGVVVGIQRHPAGWARTGSEPTPRVTVGFGSPVTEERPRGRKIEVVTYLFAEERTYDVADLAPTPASIERESVADFMARKHDPKWKPKALPRPRKLPKLSDEKLARLMAEQGWTGNLPLTAHDDLSIEGDHA